MIKNPAFYFNSELCTGCKACMIACIDKHNLNKGVLWRRVLEYSGGEWLPVGDAYEQNVFAYYVSLSCNHCENPVCAEACPTQAMHKDENGIVSVDPDRCVGCRYCEWNCPYGAPQFDPERKKMTKCDFCRDYLEQGPAPVLRRGLPLPRAGLRRIRRTAQALWGTGRHRAASGAGTHPSPLHLCSQPSFQTARQH